MPIFRAFGYTIAPLCVAVMSVGVSYWVCFFNVIKRWGCNLYSREWTLRNQFLEIETLDCAQIS